MSKKTRYKISFVVVFFAAVLLSKFPVYADNHVLAADMQTEKVSLQLKWKHQFQFAGFYAALEQGFYKSAGLDVTLIEGGAGINFIETVVSGEAEYGVEMPDLLLRRVKGEPIVALIRPLLRWPPKSVESPLIKSMSSPPRTRH